MKEYSNTVIIGYDLYPYFVVVKGNVLPPSDIFKGGIVEAEHYGHFKVEHVLGTFPIEDFESIDKQRDLISANYDAQILELKNKLIMESTLPEDLISKLIKT